MFGLLPNTVDAQALTSEELASIRNLAEERRAAWGAPGMVYGVFRGGAELATGALGVSDVETGTLMDAEMLVSVASVSKLITATTAVVLALEGQVELDSPISRHLPSLPPGLGALTLEQLLSHTAGLGEGTPFVAPSPRGDLRPVCERMTDDAFVADPGEVWGYTNMAYTLVGCVLEAAVDQPFERIVRTTVFEPLGMDRSTFSPRLAMTYIHAQGHDTRGESVRVVRPFNSAPSIAPAGELITTVRDLSRLARALMRDGLVEGSRILPPGVLGRLARPRGHGGPLAGGARDYGFGLMIRTHRGERLLEHEGVYGGFGASFVIVPDRDAAAIAVTNARYSVPALATQAAVDILLGYGPAIPSPRYTRILPGDSADAIGRYTALSDTLEIRGIEGRLSLVTDATSFAILAREEGHWEIEDFPPYRPLPATPLEVVRGSTGGVTFIRLAWRIYRRIEE